MLWEQGNFSTLSGNVQTIGNGQISFRSYKVCPLSHLSILSSIWYISCKTEDYKNFLSCATEGGNRSHVHCCKTQLVPSFCYDLCSNEFTVSQFFSSSNLSILQMLRRSHRLCLWDHFIYSYSINSFSIQILPSWDLRLLQSCISYVPSTIQSTFSLNWILSRHQFSLSFP